MPSYRCKHPTCTALLPDGRSGFCDAHAQHAGEQRAEIQRHYDQHARDPEAKKFYASAAWKRARAAKLAAVVTCERCQAAWAEHVHHRKRLDRCTPAERLDQANLMSLCSPCHNAIEARTGNAARDPDRPHVAGLLDLVDDGTWYFDADAGERPIRFIEKYCHHFEGAHAGKPFLLEPLQKRIIRDVFGWKSRTTGFRRFTQVYIEAAAGMGKSPLLAAIGLYGLMADDEPGAQIYSVAAEKEQARVVFDTAKRCIEFSPALEARLTTTTSEIAHPRSDSVWKLISGKGAKAGMKPHFVLADELHEWRNRQIYDALQARMTKRRQPIFWGATNAGESRQSFCWQLHEEATAVLEGKSRNAQLYPVIFSAPKDADPASPASWRLSNPLLGITVKEDKVRSEWERAEGSPSLEARFRRLFLTQWVQGSNKWLSMITWDRSSAPIAAEVLQGLPVYGGLDLSECDDLCAAVYVWVSPGKFYVRSRFWVPRETAERYEQKDSIPYGKWAEAGFITLLDESTISPEVRKRIAAGIVKDLATFEVKTIGYDRYKADEAIAELEAGGLTCVPIAQGYTVSPGCQELERRLKEITSIVVEPNPVMRMCAENVEVKGDDRGNFWPVKPNARNKYAGLRSAKIDGIAALVTVLTEARKHNFPKAADKKWEGGVWALQT